MNGIGGRLGGFNPYYQKRMTQKPAEEEPKKDVKPQGNESTQPKREETIHFTSDGKNLHRIGYDDDGYGDRRQILHNSDGTTIERTELRDGAILLEKKDKNGNLIGREVKRF